jgi:all-trans-8'-apo-beta-carotenal 15,15'-oxygenase
MQSPSIPSSNPAADSSRATPQRAYTTHDWQKGYQSLTQEHNYWIDDIRGTLPADLEGTLFRNGPGRLDVHGQPLQHPFDGDGMICSFAISQGRAYFRNRFVRTQGFVEEEAAGRVLYRGTFGTQKPGGWLANAFDFRLKNIANTQVIYWGGKLLALWEAAEPHRLDPHTLETLGLEYFDGALKPGQAFAAHPWIDPQCDRYGGQPCLVNFAVQPLGLSTRITLYELDTTGTITWQRSHSVPGFAFMHDMAITPDYCIFFQNPVAFNPLPFALGFKGAAECLTFQADKPTQVILIPRHPDRPMQVSSMPAGFVFHHANAFQDGDDLVVDSVAYANFPAVDPNQDFRHVNFDALPPGQLWRFRLHPSTGTIEQRLLNERGCEFPTLHPRHVGQPYRYLYLAAAHHPTGNAPLQAIEKLDLETGDRTLWSAAPHGYVSEPVFVPKATQDANPQPEDAGWLLTLVFDAEQERSHLVILDAADLGRGAIADLWLNHHVPYGLHGTFTPEYFGPAEPQG